MADSVTKKRRRTDRKSVRERFFDNLSPEPNSGCWLWAGGFRPGEINRSGPRGSLRSDDAPVGKRGRHLIASRVSWEIHCGEIPDGMNVLHKCDVGLCVNPNHLYLGTQKQNVRDCIERGRFKPRGKLYRQAKVA